MGTGSSRLHCCGGGRRVVGRHALLWREGEVEGEVDVLHLRCWWRMEIWCSPEIWRKESDNWVNFHAELCVYILKVYFPAALLYFTIVQSILTQTWKAGMPPTPAPSVLHSCSHTLAAPGAQCGDSHIGLGPEPRMKGDPPSVAAAAAAPDSSLPAPTERWRASSAGLRGKYSD